MRILQVISSLGTGGAEKLLIDSIPLYKNKGVDMELLLLNGNQTPFYKNIQQHNITIYHLSTGNIKKIYNPFFIFKIIPFLRKYDIIHVHLFPTLYWVAIAKLLAFKKVKLIYTEHSTSNKRRKQKIWRITDRFMYKRYSKIVSITEEVYYNVSSHLKLNKSKYRTICNGINLDVFKSLSKNTNIENNCSKKIIQVSSFRPPKDQATVIRSLQYLPKNVYLILVGDGDTRKECEYLVERLKITDRVSFLGIRTDISDLLQSADIVILSSNYEGLSLSSIEAMASGKPFIASNVPGLGHIVKGAGVLFPVGDEIILANEIDKLLSNTEYYNEVAQKCLERSKQYDINIMIDNYIELYKEIINNS